MCRQCKICHQIKPLTEFEIDRTYEGGRQLRKLTCKTCRSKQTKTRNQLLKIHKKPDRAVCPICQREREDIVLDHDHSTGEFRGWLCNDCNSGLGKFGDCPEFLWRAIEYLDK